ncbi:uncharacterized protein LOC105199064 [Solenopsis invicta]|uniref:uncharacterized protein LOC105199064 n=1 Tax=Solenopsis invicta TaxID=13686 RepID=UPI0005961BDD|nr:uncharacterized protein LOC105199064 [Solenopsis invicta]
MSNIQGDGCHWVPLGTIKQEEEDEKIKIEEMEELMQRTSPELAEVANSARVDTLPKISRNKYDAAYSAFTEYKKQHKTPATTQNVLCAYFKELSNTHASSTLWNRYSMLKAEIKAKENISIESYTDLIAFIRNQAVNYTPKQSEILTKDDVRKFLEIAPDREFLAAKVILIMGLMGACRCQELKDMKITNIEDRDSLLVVNIPDTKTRNPRKFVIVAGPILDIVKKYRNMRPPYIPDPSFFVQYRNGKCTSQVMGKHSLAAIPYKIATFLKLPEPKNYTGHCFRRTATTIFFNEGGDFVCLKELGGWKSDAVTRRYIKQSIKQETKICNVLTEAININENNATPTSRHTTTTTVKDISASTNSNNIIISNCIVHIHNYGKGV